MSRSWDLMIIGGGTGGIVASQTAAALGARVALVEADRPGGDCLWTGCVPSKSLISAARAAADARAAARLGVRVGEVAVDFAAVMRHVHGAIAAIEPHDSAETLARYGVEVLHGTGRLLPDGAVDVDGRQHRTRHVLLATGSTPAVPPVPGLAAQALTTDTVWELTELPGRLTVLGGGSVGCELGQAFARLGSRVTIVESADRLLATEDPDASAVVTAALEADGVTVLTGVSANAAEPGLLTLTDGRTVAHDRLLVATGRAPRTDGLGLVEAGVALDERGHVVVDEQLRTTNLRVWAAGDVTGGPQFTHVAGVHGSVAAMNAVLGLRRTAEVDVVPRVTFTDPEVAAVGLDAAAAEEHGCTVVTEQHLGLDRAITDARTEGFSRLALDRKGRLLGATVVGPRAGEALAELTLAVGRGLRSKDLRGSMHAYPTYADAAWNAAIRHSSGALGRPGIGHALRAWIRVRRHWPVPRPGA